MSTVSVNLAQHCLVFEAHDGPIVPLVGHQPRFKHACALNQDVSLRPGARSLLRCTCECLRRTTMPPGVPEVYLIAARKDYRLGLVISGQLSSGVIEIQSVADYPLHLPASWAVAKVQDCQFASYGPPRLVPRPQRVVINLVTAGNAGKFPRQRYDGPFGSAAADGGPDPKGAEGSSSGQHTGSRSNTASQRGLLNDTLGEREASSTERARSPDREPRLPRPRPGSPDPDRAPAPAAGSPKAHQMTEDGYVVPLLPTPNRYLTPEELSGLRDLRHEFRDRFNDGLGRCRPPTC